MKRKHKRLAFVVVGLTVLAAAVALVMMAFEENIVFFYSPTDIIQKKVPTDRRIRIGGLVEAGSVVHGKDALVSFRVTDFENTLPVTYSGILPDLFRESQGVVAEGRYADGIFVADEVLAKHDENYMPPEVSDALKQSGAWQHMKAQEAESSGATPDVASPSPSPEPQPQTPQEPAR